MFLHNSDLKLETDFFKYPFLRNGGEMGELIQNFDWEATSVGAIENWPVSLRNTVSMIIASKFPMFLWWGSNMLQFYNDAYRPSLGNSGKHPDALGKTGAETWPEIWDTIYPLIQQVQDGGESIYLEDQLIPIYRNGNLEDVYWTFCYSAVLNDEGIIGGVLVTCSETTEKLSKLEDVRKIKDQLEYTINANEVATWELDPVTGLINGNSVLKNWFGLLPADDIPLSAATDVILETDRDRVIATIQQLLQFESGGSYDTQYTIINPHTKKPRIVRARGQVWFKNAIPYRFNGTLVDITDAVKAQQKIDEANQLTELAVNSAGVGLFKVNLITGEINYNKNFAGIITGDPEKAGFNRKNFVQYIHKDDIASRAEALKVADNNNEVYYSIRTIWDDGSIHRITVNGANTFDSNGKPILFSGIVRDVTAQENNRIALEASENYRKDIDTKFYNVTSGAPTGLWLNDENGYITYVNKTLEDWTDKPAEYFIGKTWASMIAQPDRVQAKRAFQKAIDKKTSYDAIFRVEKYDEHLIWCRTSAEPIFDDNGKFTGHAGYCMDMDELIKSRRAVSESEIRFRSMIEQAPVATCLFTGPEMKIEVANDIMLSYWGKGKTVMGKPLADALPELKNQPFLEILDTIYKTGIAHTEISAPTKLVVNGIESTYYFDFTYKPLFDANGKVYGIMDMAIDVTDQVMARQKIEASEAKFRALIEKAPVATSLYTGTDLVIEFANEIMLGYWGKNISVIGMPLAKALPELEGQPFIELLHNIYKTGEMYQTYEALVMLEHNGILHTNFFDFTYKPLFDNDGKVYSILNMALDVTERVKARVKIENARKALHGAIELAELATWSLDIKTKIFTYSPRFMDWMGITDKSLDLNKANSVSDYNVNIEQKIRKAIEAGGSGIYDDEYAIENKITGQKRIIHSQAQITYDEGGNAIMLSGTAQDITKERKLQQQLEFEVKQRTEQLQEANAELATANNSLQQNNQELAQFAYIASHDLQEPVRKISIFTKMLKQNADITDERQWGYLDKIDNASQRMGNLIRDVLRFSVLSKDNEIFETVHLNTIIKEILNDFELIIEENNAVITYQDLPVINAIPLQMSQLFGNLISNSLKYIQPGVSPVISINGSVISKSELAAFKGAEPDASYYKIELRDNGIGFEQEYAEKIFTIFQRLHDKSSYSGTGIGLAMCKKIVQNHDGFISATGIKGEGAVFTILFPIIKQA